VKRWNVRYGPDGEVLEVRPGLQESVHQPCHCAGVQSNIFYCTAIDELGALARFMEVKEQAK
jgi:hypothetical protein